MQAGLELVSKERETSLPAHLGALIAAKTRIQAVIQDAVTYLSSLDSDEQATAKLFRRQPRQQTKLGSKQLEDYRDRASQTGPSHPLNTQALPPKMRTAMT